VAALAATAIGVEAVATDQTDGLYTAAQLIALGLFFLFPVVVAWSVDLYRAAGLILALLVTLPVFVGSPYLVPAAIVQWLAVAPARVWQCVPVRTPDPEDP